MENNFTVTIDKTMFVPWYKRLANLLIDIAVVYCIFLILGIIAALLTHLDYTGFYDWITTLNPVTDRLITTLVMVLYLFIIESFTQRSVGKFITGTMVVSEDGSKPKTRSFLIRALCRIIGLEALTFIGSTPRGWHDYTANTFVVDRKKYLEALTVKKSINEIGSEQVYEL